MNTNSIKMDTPTTSFINVADVDTETTTQLNNLEKVLNTLEDLLDKQVRVGGLSIYAYNKGGEAPLIYGAKTSAKTIYDDIDNVKANIKSLKTSIPTAAKKHKLEEYQILKEKINAHIKVLEQEKTAKKKALDEAKASNNAAAITKATNEYNQVEEDLKTYNSKLSTCNSKIKKYS